MAYTKSLFISLIALSFSFQVIAARREMNNIHFQFAADHMWLFYECGGQVYFNHENRDSRVENDERLSFSWITHSTLLGYRYCDGFGRSLIKEQVVRNSEIQSATTGSKLYLYYQSKSESQYIKFKSFSGRPHSGSDKTIWSSAAYLKNNHSEKIRAERFSVSEFGGEIYVAFIHNNKVYLRNPSGKVFSLDTKTKILPNTTFSLVSAVNKSGPKLIFLSKVLTQQNERLHQITQIDLNDLKKNKLTINTDIPKLFSNEDQVSSVSLISEMSGKIAIQYIKNNQRQKMFLDMKTLNPIADGLHKNFTAPFTSKESLAYKMVQVPINCKINSGCKLINFNYPQSANWLKSVTSLFHLAYAGKVTIEPLHTIPVEFEQMELVGIIEGPPPVPLENILASFAALPQEFVLNAARGLSKFIKTNINQVMTTVSSQSKEEARTKVHSVSMNASVPLIVPIKLSGMGSIKSKLIENISTETTSVVKKTYSNEIQHASDSSNILFMKPVGKLIFLKYDITGYQFKFLDKSNNVVPHSPSLYSLAKTNIRPVIRQYDIIARKLFPQKYQNSFSVGDLHSYKNFHRRKLLLEKATALAPGHNYLSFSYNNALDLSTEIDIKTSSTTKRTIVDSFKTEGSVGAGFGEIFGADIKMSNEEERTVSVANTNEKGMGIAVEMGFVVPTEDPSVKFYDFEVYYLKPSEDNYTELIDELSDTASKSRWNSKMLKTIKAGSTPWKITYSVSDILENENLPIDDKEDLYEEGEMLSPEHAKQDLPKTYFGLSEKCRESEFSNNFKKACQKADSFMKNR